MKWLSVDVTDVNDHAPEFEQSVYTADIYENNYNGKFVVQVHKLLRLLHVALIYT